MEVVNYNEKYRSDCLRIFKSNSGKFFSSEELVDFQLYLDSMSSNASYFVILRKGEAVACGGYESLGEIVGLC